MRPNCHDVFSLRPIVAFRGPFQHYKPAGKGCNRGKRHKRNSQRPHTDSLPKHLLYFLCDASLTALLALNVAVLRKYELGGEEVPRIAVQVIYPPRQD